MEPTMQHSCFLTFAIYAPSLLVNKPGPESFFTQANSQNYTEYSSFIACNYLERFGQVEKSEQGITGYHLVFLLYLSTFIANSGKGHAMIECIERNDVFPVCPHCNEVLSTVWNHTMQGMFGKRYVYSCPKCRKVLGISHRKGFWMG